MLAVVLFAAKTFGFLGTYSWLEFGQVLVGVVVYYTSVSLH